MPDEEQSASGAFPGLFQEFLRQCKATTERMQDLGRLGGHAPEAPGMPALPGAFSAAQMTSITDSLATQRRSIAALITQLSAFDEQLAALEQMLGPLAEWSKTWADFEQRMLNMGFKPEVGK
jgi:hypothetical protein